MSELELPPSASAGILSLRAFDYDLASALADLVDNSISAGATCIDINTEWRGLGSWITVSDDGRGMSEKVLHEAMRLGSTSPSQVRKPNDLGRFGLGLKTASIWACRHLTVFSKEKGGVVVVRTWDVDRVVAEDRWIVGNRPEGELAAGLIRKLEAVESGTVVLWEKMDTLYSGGRKGEVRSQASYERDLSKAVNLLGMTFHRFIDHDKSPVSIRSGGGPIRSWDPGVSEPPPESTHKTFLAFGGQTVKVSTHVMPYSKKMSTVEYDRAGGPGGWNAHQGFYVYRNDRLIVSGGWLGMFQSQDHYRLARVIVDIPNTLDSELGISVTKTSVRLPEGLRADLESEAKAARARSVEVFRNRGKRITSASLPGQFAMPWQALERDGHYYYLLNKKHPVYERARADAEDPRAFDALITLVEQTLPYADIVIRNGEKPESFPQPFEDVSDVERLENLRDLYAVYLSIAGTREKALEMISKTPPYSGFKDEISKL